MAVKRYEDEWGIDRGFSIWMRPNADDDSWREGTLFTPRGVVSASIYEWRGEEQVLSADIVLDGRLRRLNERRTRRDFVTTRGATRIINRWVRSL